MEGTLEPFFFLYADDSIQGNPETCKQSSIMLNYEVKNTEISQRNEEKNKGAYVMSSASADINRLLAKSQSLVEQAQKGGRHDEKR